MNHSTQYESMVGKSYDLQIVDGLQEIQLDLQVERAKSSQIWGIVKDCHDMPLENQPVKLLMPCSGEDGEYFKVVESTRTDKQGYYTLECYNRGNKACQVLIEGCNEVRELPEQLRLIECGEEPEVTYPDEREKKACGMLSYSKPIRFYQDNMYAYKG